MSGAALLGYPLDYHPRSVVNWLTRWTVVNSSASLSPAQRVAGFFFCHSARRAAQIFRLSDSGSLKKSLLMRFAPFGLLATVPACRPARLLCLHSSTVECHLSSIQPCFLRFAQIGTVEVCTNCTVECLGRMWYFYKKNTIRTKKIVQIYERFTLCSFFVHN